MKANINVSLTIDQILDIIRQLPREEKLKVTRELEREVIDSKLTELLDAFKTDELSEDTIIKEVDTVREELYEKYRKH